MTLSKFFNAERRALEESQFVARVRSSFSYDEKTGELVGNYTRKSLVDTNPAGYGRVKIGGKWYSSAKVVWVWHHKAFPPSPLKHMNGDRTDDRIENLGAKILDGTVEGAGNRWIARPKGFKRRGDILGVYRTYEKALAAFEAWERAADLV